MEMERNGGQENVGSLDWYGIFALKELAHYANYKFSIICLIITQFAIRIFNGDLKIDLIGSPVANSKDNQHVLVSRVVDKDGVELGLGGALITRVSHLQFFLISLLFQAGIYARHTKEQETYRFHMF